MGIAHYSSEEWITWDKYITDSIKLLDKAYPGKKIPEHVMPVVLMRELYQYLLYEEFDIPVERFHVIQGFSYGLDDRAKNIEYRGVGNLAEKLCSGSIREVNLFDDIRESGQTFGRFREIKEVADLLNDDNLKFFAKYEKAAGNEWKVRLSASVENNISAWLIRPFDGKTPIQNVYNMLECPISQKYTEYRELLQTWRQRIRKGYDTASDIKENIKPDIIISMLHGSMAMIALCHMLERESYIKQSETGETQKPEHDYYYINNESNLPELEELVKRKRERGMNNIILLKGADESLDEKDLANAIGDFLVPEVGNPRRITSVNRKIFA